MVWEETGLPESTESKAEVMTVKCSAAVKDFEYINTKAEAGVANTKAGTSASPTLLEASASASGLNVSADVGTKHLGAYASAEVVTARVEAGIPHTPLQGRGRGRRLPGLHRGGRGGESRRGQGRTLRCQGRGEERRAGGGPGARHFALLHHVRARKIEAPRKFCWF